MFIVRSSAHHNHYTPQNFNLKQMLHDTKFLIPWLKTFSNKVSFTFSFGSRHVLNEKNWLQYFIDLFIH